MGPNEAVIDPVHENGRPKKRYDRAKMRVNQTPKA
jgi:hypothetical protein